jgi:predicted GNAT family N-acyltransferase
MGNGSAARVIEVSGDRVLMDQAWTIRRRVFIEEQHVPEEIELDDDDSRAVHVLALQGGLSVGCGRMVANGQYVKIGRMAVLREWRGTGIGRALIEFLVTYAQRQGFRHAVLDAQLHAEGFYSKLGFAAIGEVFEEAGIAHRRMERSL